MRAAIATILAVLALVVLGQGPRAHAPAAPRFEAVDVYVDSGERALGAYQIELRAAAEGARVVGIEGGEHAAFAPPPYYDPAALHEDQLRERIVLAAFSTGQDLPTGRVRVARVHVQVSGGAPARYEARIEAAGAADGTRIEATVEVVSSRP